MSTTPPEVNVNVSTVNPASIRAVLDDSAAVLARAGVPSPGVDAELLVGHVLGISRGGVQAKAVVGAMLGIEELLAVSDAVERRAAREPLQHITGRAAFRAMELAVGPGVFVPRPETETVVQFAIDALAAVASPQPIGVDLGTGSGAIALAMATEVPHSRVFGVEVSPQAFIWTKQNFREYGGTNAKAIFTDLAVALPDLDGTVDVVISNPPYIPIAAIPRDPEVRLFDPEIALYGGEDGLVIVRQVSTTARRLLHEGGTLVLEHGELQADDITAILRGDGWHAVATHPDLLGRDRATTAVR